MAWQSQFHGCTGLGRASIGRCALCVVRWVSGMSALQAPNKLQRSLMRLDEAPAFMRGFVQNIILRRAVPFTGTAGVKFVSLTPERVEFCLL